MAAYFFDLDGTCVNYHTSEWLPGVKEKLATLALEGHRIYFITMRGIQDAGTPWSIIHTHKLLRDLPFEYHLLVGVPSPRILIDDNSIGIVPTLTNTADWLDEIDDLDEV